MTKSIIILGKADYLPTKENVQFYENLGAWLAKNKFNAATGACSGVAYLIGEQIVKHGGSVYGYSPADGPKAHQEDYHFPLNGCSHIIYEKEKLPINEAYFHRSIRMFLDNKNSIVVSFNGSRGTFSELCAAFFMARTIVLATFTGGATRVFPYFSKFFKLFKFKYGADIRIAKSFTELQQIILSLSGDIDDIE